MNKLFIEQVSRDFLEKLNTAQPEAMKQLSSWMLPLFGEMLETLDWRQSLREPPINPLPNWSPCP